MGCSTCTTGGGCSTHKGPQREAIALTLASVYPSGRWGELDDEAAFGRGIDLGGVKRLAPTLSAAAKAPVLVVTGNDGDLCNYIYVLCVGREPSLVALRERGEVPADAAAATEHEPAAKVEETYLRVVCSTIANVASLQETTISIHDGVFVETARPGVYAPTLLKRTRALVAAIEAQGIEHLDFGLVDKPSGLQPGDYVERYGCEPKIVNYLYYAEPVETARIVAAGIDSAAPEPWIAADEHAERSVAHE